MHFKAEKMYGSHKFSPRTTEIQLGPKKLTELYDLADKYGRLGDTKLWVSFSGLSI